MKVIPLLSILLFVNNVASDSSRTIGDIVVSKKNGILYCDSMACPPEAVNCRVTKRNDPNDFMKIVRVRQCVNRNRENIAEETVFERNTDHRSVDVNVMSGGGSGSNRKLTPEEKRQLEENLRRTKEQIQAEINETMANVAKEKERMLADIRNSRNKWY